MRQLKIPPNHNLTNEAVKFRVGTQNVRTMQGR